MTFRGERVKSHSKSNFQSLFEEFSGAGRTERNDEVLIVNVKIKLVIDAGKKETDGGLIANDGRQMINDGELIVNDERLIVNDDELIVND